MNKKIIAIAAAGTMLALAAGPAFGSRWHHSSDDVTIINRASVRNKTVTIANTGLVMGGGRTGNARAVAYVSNDVNFTEVGCGCLDGDLTVNNRASVKNKTVTIANTGLVMGGRRRGGRGGTGNAVADSVVTNAVNTTVVGGN